jgi:hypothetical protein
VGRVQRHGRAGQQGQHGHCEAEEATTPAEHQRVSWGEDRRNPLRRGRQRWDLILQPSGSGPSGETPVASIRNASCRRQCPQGPVSARPPNVEHRGHPKGRPRCRSVSPGGRASGKG